MATPRNERHGYVAVGVDIAEARKGLDAVAIDVDHRIVASHGRLTIADVVSLVVEFAPQVVCIDSPSGWSKSGRSRHAERDLRRLGISAFSTPTDPGDHAFYRWMRVGFALYNALRDSYSLFNGDDVAGTAAEVFPEASAVLLAGQLRSGQSKVRFRRQILEENNVDAAALPNLDRVDAALGALTGILALEGCYSTVGDPAEGLMLLPVSRLPPTRLIQVDGASTLLGRVVAPSRESNRVCLCGCGESVRRRFLPGHDAKLKARLLRLHRAGDEAAREQLKALGWLA